MGGTLRPEDLKPLEPRRVNPEDVLKAYFPPLEHKPAPPPSDRTFRIIDALIAAGFLAEADLTYGRVKELFGVIEGGKG